MREALAGLQRTQEEAEARRSEWARSVPGGRVPGYTSQGATANNLGDWLDEPTLADEASVEAPTLHPQVAKKKRIIHQLRKEEGFRKPTADGLVICKLCEYGPVGNNDVEESDVLRKFNDIYNSQLGKLHWLRHQRQLRDFWNEYIATPLDDVTVTRDERVPFISVSDIYYHYNKCSTARDFHGIFVQQITEIRAVQKTLRDNGMYVVPVDESVAASGSVVAPSPTEVVGGESVVVPEDDEAAGASRKRKRKGQVQVNPKIANQWREFGRQLIYTMKEYRAFMNEAPADETTKKRRKTAAKKGGGGGESGGGTSFKDY